MTAWIQLAVLWLLAALMMSLGWRWQRPRSNAGIVDALWAGGVAAARCCSPCSVTAICGHE